MCHQIASSITSHILPWLQLAFVHLSSPLLLWFLCLEQSLCSMMRRLFDRDVGNEVLWLEILLPDLYQIVAILQRP